VTEIAAQIRGRIPLDPPHEEQGSGSPRPEDAAFELGLRGLGHPRGRAALGRSREEAKVAGKGHHRECRPDWPRERLHALATDDLALAWQMKSDAGGSTFKSETAAPFRG
jgi:hypothetical protein